MARLQRAGARRRDGALWCKVLIDDSADPARLALAVGRPVGSAVIRNRLRRRIRAIVRELVVHNRVAPGWYLIGAQPAAATLSFDQLTASVTALVANRR